MASAILPRLQNWNQTLKSKFFLIQNSKITKSLRMVS